MSEFDDLVIDNFEFDDEFTKQSNDNNILGSAATTTEDTTETTKKASAKRAKLDDERLLGDKGIAALKNRSQYLSFRGKGHEEQDLKDLMQFYMLWANNLFPKLKFQDFAKRVTKPASSALVKAQIKQWQDEFKEKRQIQLEAHDELTRQESEDEPQHDSSSEDDNRPLFIPITKPLPNKPKKPVHKQAEDQRKRKMVSLDSDSEEEQESGSRNRHDALAVLQERRRKREEAKKREQEREEQEALESRKMELERPTEELAKDYLGEDVELALSDNELFALTQEDAHFSDQE